MTKEEVRDRLGNIDQIRDIIFGAHLRDYEDKFNKMESSISLLQQEMRTNLEQLKASVTMEIKAEIESLDKKLRSLSITTQEEAFELRQQADRMNRKFSSSLQSLDDAIDEQTNSIRDEFTQTKTQLEGDMNALRDVVLEELERRFSQLKQNKVSKDDMAETLFALGMRLKGAEFIPMLHEASCNDNSDEAPLMYLNGRAKKTLGTLSHTNGSAGDNS
ncbi:MAG: hypothetical protein AAF378_02560 [Cyanobacteria bacterium P01_A01_bin.84]